MFYNLVKRELYVCENGRKDNLISDREKKEQYHPILLETVDSQPSEMLMLHNPVKREFEQCV